MTMKKSKNISLRITAMFLAVLVFTFFDWMVHSSFSYLAVPTWYFRNKIIFGTLYASLASLIFKKGSVNKQAIIITAITVSLLQIRYALYGYPLLFHLIVLSEHFVFMYFASLCALKIIVKI